MWRIYALERGHDLAQGKGDHMANISLPLLNSLSDALGAGPAFVPGGVEQDGFLDAGQVGQ